MGMAGPLILVANPGSASRKYALFKDGQEHASLHFEHENGAVICTLRYGQESRAVDTREATLETAAASVAPLLRQYGITGSDTVSRIGLRIVAPSNYFLEHREITEEVTAALHHIQPRAPLHVTATLQELDALHEAFPNARIFGASDSAFHKTKPDYAWNYGISLADADRFELKRFGYHGLSVASVVQTLTAAGKLPPRLIVAHIGSGVSVTAVRGGRSLDTTMGYSPLEGPIMATRSGNLDITAAHALQDAMHLNNAALADYLHTASGLEGLGGSSDIRELLRREASGDHRATLALQTYVFSLQKAIGQMVAALGGADMLVFTGTVGERSAPIRERILTHLHYLDFFLAPKSNNACSNPDEPVLISRLAQSKPIMVVPANEAAQIALTVQHAQNL
ncbi:MAG TPA: hypothetical protein VLA88_06430 [Candidatus Saccharimonadales bacterium]|nr:hypothetical protein [Candidatus Saccharimonadales bacterium]